MKLLATLLCFVALSCFACGESQPQNASPGESIVADDATPAQAETPAAAVAEMLRLAKAGQWGEMIDGYYGEADKFTSLDDREKLIQRFEEGWGEQWIGGLEKAVGIEPTIEDDQAVFIDDGQTLLKLHRAEDGRWAFHL